MGKSVKAVGSVVGLNAGGKGGLTGADAVNIGKTYNPETTGFKQTEAQKAYQARLKARSEGKETSLAEMQLKESQDRVVAQQAAAASAARGNQALAQRESIRAGAGAQQQNAAAAAQLRAQEQEAALGAYGQDLTREAGSLQQLENVRAGIGAQNQQLQYQANQQAAQNRAQQFSSGSSAALAMLSDKNVKTDIKKKDLDDMVSKIHAYKYKYKEPNGEDYQSGEATGIMAQDLEKSKTGKTLVSDTPNGKMIDLKKAVPLMMASVSEIVKKIKKLEKSRES